MHLLELLVLRPLELLLEEHNHFLHIAAGGKAKDNTDSLSADLEVSATQISQPCGTMRYKSMKQT